MENPYKVLGVGKDATAEDIRKAYHKLAKRYHPDLNPGKPEAEQRFKTVSAAYDLLSDPQKRGRFDRGEIDAAGNETAAAAGDPFGGFHRARQGGFNAGGPGAGGPMGPGGVEFDLNGLFGDLFGAGAAGGGGFSAGSQRYALDVDFLDAANGGKCRLTLADGKTIDLAIPAGTADGQVLRLRGTPPTLVEIKIRHHPWFTRAGDDIHVDVPITVAEAALGAKIKVPTIGKPVMVTVPPGSETGTVLRLRGKGIHRGGHAGDQIVTLRLYLGGKPDAELTEALRQWAERHPADLRRHMVE